MKYVASIREYEKDSFFSPIKTTFEYVHRVIAVLEKIILYKNEHKRPRDSYILIDEETCAHRVFIVSKAKIESFVLDYNIMPNETGTMSVAVKECILTMEVLSCARTIANLFLKDDREWINEEDNDLQSEYKCNILDSSHKLIRQIIYSEPSYLRYDYDPEHAKENKHLKHHLDVNYSDKGTYKIGINSRNRTTDIDWLMDVLSKETDCYMLEKIK